MIFLPFTWAKEVERAKKKIEIKMVLFTDILIKVQMYFLNLKQFEFFGLKTLKIYNFFEGKDFRIMSNN